MDDLNETASRHQANIRDELWKASRTLSPDAFVALVHDLNERISDLAWHALHFNTSAAFAMEKAFGASSSSAPKEPVTAGIGGGE
jgi:hypothetical protein